MGSKTSPPSIPHDLKVSILSSTRLHPSEPTERRSMFISNIDQSLNFGVFTVHFFTVNPDFPIDTVVAKLRSAVEKLLIPYDFLAGTLKFNPSTGRSEIDCDNVGAGLVVAASELALAELGPLEFPNPAFRQLTPAEMAEPTLISFQVTSFKCGGFALGVSNNHATFDGLSCQLFLKNLAAVAAGDPLPVPPHTDRRLLAARSPPHVDFPHPELFVLDAPPTVSPLPNPVASNLHVKLLHLSSTNITTLKIKASPAGRAATSFNSVTAHLWRCKTLSSVTADPEKPSTVLFAVDLRNRMNPPLPAEYAGNAVLTAHATATRKELEELALSRVVEKVAEAAARMDDAYARSIIDWGELHLGFPNGDVFISSWWKLGLMEVEYPWGRPVYSSPVVNASMDVVKFVLLLPDIGGASMGVNALVALPADQMKRFEELFYMEFE